MNKLLKYFIIFLSVTLIFSVNHNKILAYQNTGSGGTSETGIGTAMFESGAHHFTNGSLQPDTIIRYCNWNCSSYKTATAAEFLGYHLKNPAEARKIFSSKDVWIRTHAGLSQQAGAPVFYGYDGTQKGIHDWDVPGDPAGNALAQKYIRQIGSNNPAFLSGSFGTTILYSNYSGINSGDRGIVGDPDGNNYQSITTCSPSDKPRYVFKKTSGDGFEKLEGVYATYIEITPVRPKNFESLSEEQQIYWTQTHQAQKTKVVLTPWGEYLKDNRETLRRLRELEKAGGIGANSDYRKLWEQFAAGAKNAIGKGVPETKVEITGLNKEGFSRGGVFTFTEMSMSATVQTTHSQDYYDEYRCTNVPRTVSYSSYEEETKVVDGKEVTTYKKVIKYKKVDDYRYRLTKVDTKIDGQYTKEDVVAITGTNYVPRKSYQTLNVRCNADEFNSIVAATNSTVMTIGSGYGSATALSPTVENQKASFFDNLTVDFFYNGNSCSQIFGCTSETLSNELSDAKSNGLKEPSDGNSGFGAQADGKEASKFSFFRDNMNKLVRNDVWFIKYLGNHPEVNYDPQTSISKFTLIILDKKGTPQKDLFALEDTSGKVLIDGRTLQEKNGLVLSGEVNKFNWRASWASESDKPHGMNIKYAYKPSIKNNSISTMSNITPTWEEKEYILDYICDVNFNVNDVVVPMVKNQPKEENYKPLTDFDSDPNKALRVEFVKASAE